MNMKPAIMLGDSNPLTTCGLATEFAKAAGNEIRILSYVGAGASTAQNHHYTLDIEHLKEANRYLMRANKNMHRSWPRQHLSADNALRRDCFLARYAHRIYVIGLFTQDASLLKINTDAAWAAQMYIDRFLYDQEPWELCELYIFDMKSESWWQWMKHWIRIDSVPEPDGVFTVIGLDKLTNAGKSAIRDLWPANQ